MNEAFWITFLKASVYKIDVMKESSDKGVIGLFPFSDNFCGKSTNICFLKKSEILNRS